MTYDDEHPGDGDTTPLACLSVGDLILVQRMAAGWSRATEFRADEDRGAVWLRIVDLEAGDAVLPDGVRVDVRYGAVRA